MNRKTFTAKGSGALLAWELVETRGDRVCVHVSSLDGHPAGYAVGTLCDGAFTDGCACEHWSAESAWACRISARAEAARLWASVDWSWWPCARLLRTGVRILNAPLPRNGDGSPDLVSGETRLYATASLLALALGWTEARAELEAEWAADRASDVPLLGEPWQWAHPIREGAALESCRWRTRREPCLCFRCSHSGIQRLREGVATPVQGSLFGGVL